MGRFDFLNKFGESKENFEIININKNIQEKVELLEILSNRKLVPEDFKSELLNLLVENKINDENFYKNVNKAIDIMEKVTFEVLSIDEDMFKLKNHEYEYVGSLTRMKGNETVSTKNSGKVSYFFLEQIFSNLKNKEVSLKQVNTVSDIFDFDLLSVINVKQINIPTG